MIAVKTCCCTKS